MRVAPHIIAHRGASARAPENTLAAFRLAVDHGADGLELDVQITADFEPIVLHDETVDRTTNGHGEARSLKLAQIKELDAGVHFSDDAGGSPFRGRGIQVPTLREVLQEHPGLWMSVDLKQGDPQTELRVLEVLREERAMDHVVLGAENPAAARRLRKLAPECASFFSRGEVRDFVVRERLGFWWGYRTPASSLQIPVRGGGLRLDRPRLIQRAHEQGAAVRYWTINDAEVMHRLFDRGADGIITDRPDVAAEVLRERHDS